MNRVLEPVARRSPSWRWSRPTGSRKLWIANRMALGETRSLVDGWLYFVHRQNPGVAFSMLADLPDAWRVPLLTLASLVGVVLFARIVLSSPDPWCGGRRPW